LTITEAAEKLNVNAETLRRWDNSGKLLAIKINERGDRRYRREDIDALIQLTTDNSGKYKLIETYDGYQIYLTTNRFEHFHDRFGSFATFFLKNGLIVKTLVFAIAGMDWMAEPQMSENELL